MFQAAGQTVTPEQLALIQQNAAAVLAQQFGNSQAQAQQTALLQAMSLIRILKNSITLLVQV